jgi:hypothetical protein
MKSILEREMEFGMKVAATTWSGPATSSTETEQIPEPTGTTEQVPKVLDTELLTAPERSGTTETLETARIDHSSDLVVLGALLFVGEGGVGLRDILEPILGFRVVWVGVGM